MHATATATHAFVTAAPVATGTPDDTPSDLAAAMRTLAPAATGGAIATEYLLPLPALPHPRPPDSAVALTPTAFATPLATTTTSLPSLPAATPTSTATPRALTATSRAPTATNRALAATTCIHTAAPWTLTTDANDTTRGPAI